MEVPWTILNQTSNTELTQEEENELLEDSNENLKRSNDNVTNKGKPVITNITNIKNDYISNNLRHKYVSRYYLNNVHSVADDITKTTPNNEDGQIVGGVHNKTITIDCDALKTLHESCNNLKEADSTLAATNKLMINFMEGQRRQDEIAREMQKQEAFTYRQTMTAQAKKMGDAIKTLMKRIRELDDNEVNDDEFNTNSQNLLEVQDSNISRDQISTLIRDEINKIEIDKNNSKQKTINSVTNKLLKLEVISKEFGPKRDYKLTQQTKFEHFYGFLTSELNDLLYVINDKESTNKTTNFDENTKKRHQFRVRDIIINRIDQNYYSRVSKLMDPTEIIKKLKEIKRCETNVTSLMIRKQLYDMQYSPSKEKAAEFIDKFEDVIRNYENLPNSTVFPNVEKRDAFYKAIMYTIPQVQSLEFLTKAQKDDGSGLTFEQLKQFIVQAEASSIKQNQKHELL